MKISSKKESKVRGRLGSAAYFADRSTLQLFQTGAVVINRKTGKTISAGWSHYSPLRLVQYRSIHAELHAVLNAYRDALPECDIYVAAKNRKSGNLTLSHPCGLCLAILYESAVQGAYYTTGNDTFSYVNIRDAYEENDVAS